MEKPWNTTCPSCQDVKAYKGFLVCECPNSSCKYYTKTQDELVSKYINELDQLEDELQNTIPGNSFTDDGYYKTISHTNNSSNNTPATSYQYSNNNTQVDPNDPYGFGSGYYNNTIDDDCDDNNTDVQDLFGII